MELLKDESFIKAEFGKHFNLYKKHLKQAESIKDFSEIWSNVQLDFCPYESEMNQATPPKIYHKTPKTLKGKIVNRLQDDRIYYAFLAEQKNWNSIFYLYEDHAATMLKYDDQNDDDKILLSQIFHKISESGLIKKVLFYMPDDCVGDTFLVDTYIYDDKERIETIARKGYYGDENDVHNYDYFRTFRFEYENDRISIYSKQLLSNGENQFKLIFPINEMKKNRKN